MRTSLLTTFLLRVKVGIYSQLSFVCQLDEKCQIIQCECFHFQKNNVQCQKYSCQATANEYERWVQQMFDPVSFARSLVSATKWGPLAKLCAVQKNKHGHNFQNIGSKRNQRLVIVYDITLIHFGSDILKIVAVLFFFNGS